MASARRHAAATPSTRPHESLRTASRPRSAQGELLLRYPRILETRVIINRPSDVAVADPECKADSHLNCVQARGNPLMGVFRRGNQSSTCPSIRGLSWSECGVALWIRSQLSEGGRVRVWAETRAAVPR